VLIEDGPMILSGRNRWLACKIAGVAPRFVTYEDGWNGDPRSEVISSNLHRVHLTPGQKTWVALQYTQLKVGALTQVEAARRTGVHIDRIRRASAINREALPAIIAAIVSGRIKSIDHAFSIVTLDKDERGSGLTSIEKQTRWLNDPRSIGGTRKPGRPVYDITAKQIAALVGDKRLAVARMILKGLSAHEKHGLLMGELTPQEKLDLILELADAAEQALEPGMRIFIGETP
jgi:hypothetical protein